MVNNIIKSCMSILKINNIYIDRNFIFQLFRESNKHCTTLEVFINYTYAFHIKLFPKINDICIIYIQNNESEQESIFQGTITSINYKDNLIKLKADYIGIDENIFEETFIDCDTKTIISQFIPNLQYEASNPNNHRLILKDTKYSNLLRLLNLHKMNYFIDKKHQIVIMDGYQKKQYNKYDITNCIRSIDFPTITIFPIPELEIGDIVYNNNQKFYVTDIVYNFSSQMKMKLGVQYVNNVK